MSRYTGITRSSRATTSHKAAAAEARARHVSFASRRAKDRVPPYRADFRLPDTVVDDRLFSDSHHVRHRGAETTERDSGRGGGVDMCSVVADDA